MHGISGKVAVVTGAGQGIGASTAMLFAREDAKVVVSDVLDDKGAEVVAAIKAAGGDAIYVHADVSSEEQVKALIDKTVQTYGRLDFGINNAGIGGLSAPTGEYTLEAWNKVIGINLTGVFLCMRYEIPEMLKTGAGAIVNVSSILGWVGFANSPAYVAAKHAVIGLTKTAALEYGPQNLRVTAVSPAFIQTPLIENAGITPGSEMYSGLAQMHALKRLGTPEEVAELIVWLCSDAASFMTGSAVLVDGGYVAH